MRLSPPANLNDFDRASDPQLLYDAWEVIIGNRMNGKKQNNNRQQ